VEWSVTGCLCKQFVWINWDLFLLALVFGFVDLISTTLRGYAQPPEQRQRAPAPAVSSQQSSFIKIIFIGSIL
jgi:hypothetical protein